MSRPKIYSTTIASLLACLLLMPTAMQASLLAQDTYGAQRVSMNTENVIIEVNKGQLIRLDSAGAEFFIADPTIADVQVKSSQLIYLLGKQVGETSFDVLDENNISVYSATIRVTQNLETLYKNINNLLPDTSISVTNMGDLLVLSGVVNSPEESALAERIALSTVGATQVLNQLKITQPTQVQLRVKIAEVNRSVLKQLGVNWENTFSGTNAFFGLASGRDVFETVTDNVLNTPVKNYLTNTGIGNAFAGGFTSGNFDLNFIIDALENEGFLSVLAEPNLSAVTGETADFLAGGEYPIPVPSRDGIGIEYKPYGVKLTFTPTVLNSGKISLKVAPEVSDLSNAGALQIEGTAVPSITTRRAQTTVELGSGQSLAIAGLLESKVLQDSSKLPFLGDIPILGALFRSDSFRRNETELLIVVTPYIVEPVDDRNIALPTDGYIAPTDMDRYLKGKKWQQRTAVKTPGDTTKNEGATLKGRAGFQLK